VRVEQGVRRSEAELMREDLYLVPLNGAPPSVKREEIGGQPFRRSGLLGAAV
jgi:hypothetical protein